MNLACQIGQLVDGENAAIGAGQQAIVDSHLAAEFVPAPGCFDGIDITNQVGDGDVGRGQFLHITFFGSEICNRSFVAPLGDQVPATAANGRVRIVVNLATGDVRRLRIKQSCQRAQDAALGLPAQAQQDEVVPRQHSVDDLGHDRVVIAHNSGEDGRPLAQFGDEVFA